MKNKNSLNANVKKHINEIPRIIWYPIAAIIHTIFSLMQHLYVSSLRISKKQEFEEEHSIKIMRRAIKSVLSNNSNIVNNYNNKRMNKIFTLLLEIISFLTTYVGFKFFLSNVSAIAPIFMAIVVQGGCYYLMNNLSSNKHKGARKRGLLLAILIFISTITSYMGVFNGVISPDDYIEKVYNSYQEESNALLEQYSKSQNYISVDQSVINEYYVKYDNLIKEATIERDSIESNNQFSTGHWQNDEYGRKWVPDSKLVESKSKKGQKINSIDEYIKNLRDFKNNNSAQVIATSYKNILANPDILNDDKNKNTSIYQGFVNSIYDYRNLYKLIKNDKKSDDDILDSLNLRNLSNVKQEYDSIYLDDFDTISKNIVSSPSSPIKISKDDNKALKLIKQFIIYFLPDTDTNSEALKKLISDTIDKNYDNLHKKLQGESKENLEKLKDQSKIPNVQVLPFILPFEKGKEPIGTAVFSAFVAISVDGLALMFSIALLNKRDSSLYYNNIDKYRQLREEIMEDCLMYNCLNELDDLNKNFDVNEIGSVIAKQLNTSMNGFMNKIHQCYFPTSFNSYGYICDKDLCQFSDAENNIFISLNNISMIKPFHRDELITVLNHDFSQIDNDNVISEMASQSLIEKYEKTFKDDEVYYMVSKSVHVWFCDNFSELLENNMIFDNEDNELLNISTKEE